MPPEIEETIVIPSEENSFTKFGTIDDYATNHVSMYTPQVTDDGLFIPINFNNEMNYIKIDKEILKEIIRRFAKEK